MQLRPVIPSVLAADLSSLPSVDLLLNTIALRRAQVHHGRERVTAAVRAHLAELRAAARADGAALPDVHAIATAVGASLDALSRSSLRKVINLTGTVLHTNLGRALLPENVEL